MKICLIGPSYPFRGGISHYTTLLYRHLKKKHNVQFYAFRRQYPHWLFPGNTDKDNSSNPISEEGVENVLDSMNPITWIKVSLKIKKANSELVIFPWWVAFWTPQFWTITTLTKMFSPAKILFICHNFVEHESSTVSKICTKFVLRKGDYFVVHSGEDFENLKKIISDGKIKQSFHPTYEVFYSGGISKEEARRRLRITGNTILFFGFIRPYKGLEYLIEAMPIITKHIDVNLLIVGEFWRGEEECRNQIEYLQVKEDTKIINRYIPNEEVELYFAACDLVVLPYLSATGSGIVQAAFGCKKPVVTTSVGCLPQVVNDKETGYIVPPRNPKAIAHAVVSFYKEEKEHFFVRNIVKEREKFSWDRMVETIESFL